MSGSVPGSVNDPGFGPVLQTGQSKREMPVSFIKDASYTFATKLTLLIIGIFSSIISVRILGAEGKGLFTLGIISASVIFNLANLGVGTGAGYYLGRKKVELEDLAGNWLSLSVMIGAVVTVLSLAVMPLIAGSILPAVPLKLIITGLLSIPFMILTFNFQMLSKANSDFLSYNIAELIQRLSFVVFFPLFILLISCDRVFLAVVIYIVSTMISAFFLLLRWSRVVRLRFRLDRGLAGSVVRFGIKGHLSNFLGFLNLRLDILLINYFIGPAAVGFYSISVMIAERMWYLPDALGIALYPKVAHYDDDRSNRATAAVCRQTMILILLSIVVVLVAGKTVIRLFYTDSFLAALIPLFLLLPGVLSAGITRVVSSDLLARGHPGVNMAAGGAALAVNIISNIILIPRIGISGAAVSTSISYFVQVVVTLISFKKITRVAAASLLIPRYEDLRLFAGALNRIISSFRRGSSTREDEGDTGGGK
ncbi:MAG: oligosaccharide flippase family protein [Candidatus Krumholzibacteriota bacterium]|nr:oligosaccharide flippase family protein [Candidatus Krumholzibacteriota bacterium]